MNTINKSEKRIASAVLALCLGCALTSGCGQAGSNGTPGASGVNGESLVYMTLAATVAQCANGGEVLLIAQDTLNTGSYSTSDLGQSALIMCNGANGTNGTTPESVMFPIAPCTTASSPYKEELLCLNDGNILGSFSDNANGLNTRFAFLPAGSFVDTDDSGCQFSVSIDSKGDSTLSYSAGSNSYGSWVANSITCTNNE